MMTMTMKTMTTMIMKTTTTRAMDRRTSSRRASTSGRDDRSRARVDSRGTRGRGNDSEARRGTRTRAWDGDVAAAADVARAAHLCARECARYHHGGVGHVLDFIGDATARSFEALRPRIDAESGVTPLSFVKRGVALAQDAMGLVNGDRPEETLPTCLLYTSPSPRD